MGRTRRARARAGVGDRGGKQGGAGGGAVPEVFGNDFDFVPGENLLVFDDFSDTEVGDYPARWSLKDGGGGPSEVVEADGKRWFHQRKSELPGSSQRNHGSWLRYQAKGDMPTKFTIELDVLAGELGFYYLRSNDGRDFVTLGPEGFRSANTSVDAQPFWKTRRVQHVSIAVNGTSVKIYVGGKRFLNDPDGLARPISRLGLAFGSSGAHSYPGTPYDGIMITNFRLAEGGKDITQALNAEGRFVTHGITFDSGLDRIRPESGPTLRKLLKLLKDDGGMGFEIIGHTDSQGGEKVNGPLSERRAAAVKAWLVAQGVEDGRLTTKGLGASKPLKPNDSTEGRAENRRVEFVKLK